MPSVFPALPSPVAAELASAAAPLLKRTAPKPSSGGESLAILLAIYYPGEGLDGSTLIAVDIGADGAMSSLARQVNEAVAQIDSAWRVAASEAAARRSLLASRPQDDADSDAHMFLMQAFEAALPVRAPLVLTEPQPCPSVAELLLGNAAASAHARPGKQKDHDAPLVESSTRVNLPHGAHGTSKIKRTDDLAEYLKFGPSTTLAVKTCKALLPKTGAIGGFIGHQGRHAGETGY